MKTKIGIIGCGNMGAAILAGIYKKYTVLVCEQDRKRARSVKKKYKVRLTDLELITKECSVIILAVKPQGFSGLLNAIKPLIKQNQLIVSIAAGITTKYIEKTLGGGKAKVIRTMPNLPSQIGMGITAIARGKRATTSDLKKAKDIFGLIGEVAVVDEKLIDAVTAVSGSGPAYLFYFVESLEAAARSIGLNAQQSKQFVVQTLAGSLELLKSSKLEASVLKKQVTSKGGTTQAALKVFEKNKMNKTIKDALMAAKRRAKELSR